MLRALLLAPVVLTACACDPEPALLPAWHGIWRGALEHGAPGGSFTLVPMELQIGPIEGHRERLRFALVYGSGPQRDVRDYELVPVDLAAGLVRIDERNGVVLEATLRADSLVTSFVVAGQLTTMRFVLPDGVIEFSCEAIDLELAQGATSRGESVASRVTQPKVLSVQRARLVNPEKLPRLEPWYWDHWPWGWGGWRC